MGTAGAQTSQGLEELSIKEVLAFLLAMLVTCSLVFNALFAFSALDGARMLAQVAEEHGVAVESLGLEAEHFGAVKDRYDHTVRGDLLYYFEWMGGAMGGHLDRSDAGAGVDVAAARVASCAHPAGTNHRATGGRIRKLGGGVEDR